jgi:hypothetical protein
MNMDKEHFKEEEQEWHSYRLAASCTAVTFSISRAIALHSPDLTSIVI